ncbi:MAG: DNA polymerase III subunit beta [Planctomycetota bacterium]
MQIKVRREKLYRYIQVLETITPTKSVVPILQNLKIAAVRGDLMLFATDLEVGLQYILREGCEIIEGGEILLPAKKLADTLQELDDEEIIIKAEDGTCLIKPTYEGRWFYKFLVIDASNFPQFPKIEKSSTPVELELVDFKDMVNKTSFSVSDGIANYALSGILLESLKNEFRMVSTDGVRLSLVKREIVGGKLKPFKAIVPVKAIRILEKIVDDEKRFSIYFDETTMQIKLSNGIFFSRLIEGNFPDYEEVIPQKYKIKVAIPLDKFISRLRTILVFASERAKTVKLILKKGSLQLYTTSNETGEAFTKEIPVDYSGEDFSIVLNPVFLSDVSRVINDEMIYLYFNEGTTAPVIVKEKDDYIHLIMPISVQ